MTPGTDEGGRLAAGHVASGNRQHWVTSQEHGPAHFVPLYDRREAICPWLPESGFMLLNGFLIPAYRSRHDDVANGRVPLHLHYFGDTPTTRPDIGIFGSLTITSNLLPSDECLSCGAVFCRRDVCIAVAARWLRETFKGPGSLRRHRCRSSELARSVDIPAVPLLACRAIKRTAARAVELI